MRNTRLRNTLRLAGSVFLILILSGCESLLPPKRSQIARFEQNLFLWNSLLSRYPELPPIPPPTGNPITDDTRREVNELFAVAFSVMSGKERAGGAGQAVKPESRELPAVARKAEQSVVKVGLERGEGKKDPFVHGVLLTADGWVVTVRHPFDSGTAPLARVYLTSEKGKGRYPLKYVAGTSRTNATIARFDLPRAGINDEDLPPPLLRSGAAFGSPEAGESAWVLAAKAEVLLDILDTDRELELTGIGVYQENYVTNNPAPLDSLRSGAPLFTSAGELCGLYYHRALDGRTAGFASFTDLPRQLGHAILTVLADTNPEGE
jgi:hypothetical protein